MHDLHLHLYGCVTPEMIWRKLRSLGGTTQESSTIKAKLSWFEAEYKKAFKTPSGIFEATLDRTPDAVAKIFCVTKKSTFLEFQARFNLAIAAFPVVENKSSVMQEVLKNYESKKYPASEFRVFLPHYLEKNGLEIYLDKIFLDLESFGSDRHHIAFSLQRQIEIFSLQIEFLEWYFLKNSNYKKYVSGIDLSGYENSQHFDDLLIMNGRVKTLSENFPRSVGLLLHIGETWRGNCPELKLQEIFRVADFSNIRLGHASIVGVDFDKMAASELLDFHPGYLVNDWERFNMIDERKDRVFQMQEFVIQKLRDKKIVIESCPSSNLFLGELDRVEDLAVFRFLKNDLQVVLGSDDPGIFATNLKKEFALINLTEPDEGKITARADKLFTDSVA